MIHNLHLLSWSRPKEAYAELVIAYSDALFEKLKYLSSPTMDVANLRPKLDAPAREALREYINLKDSYKKRNLYVRIVMVGNSASDFEETIELLRNDSIHLVAQWRIFTTLVESHDDSRIFEAIGRAVALGAIPPP